KTDYHLRLPGQPPLPAENLRRDDVEDRFRLFFRLPTPPRTLTAEVCYRTHSLGQLVLPILTEEVFVQNLRVQMSTLFVRLVEQTVACQTFVATQGRGLLASAVLASPTSLVPLLDLGLQVEFRA